MLSLRDRDRIVRTVEGMRDEMVGALQELVRIDTVVPPGNNYRRCAETIRDMMASLGYEAHTVDVPPERFEAMTRTMGIPVPGIEKLPRVNVFGRKEGARPGRTMHFTGHFDVVPPGQGWTVDPFGGTLRDGRVYGRGSTDQKSGIVASLFAVEALRRAGLEPAGAIEQSATVDEEWAGEMGLGYLVERGYLQRGRQDYVVITECLDVDGICLGHRGALIFSLQTTGKVGHGCMPQLAENAVERMARLMAAVSTELRPLVERRVSPLPILPEASRRSSISPIWIDGAAAEKPGATIPASCTSFWNRWFNPEESLDGARREILDFLESLARRDPELSARYVEHYSAEPVSVPPDGEIVRTFREEILSVLGHESHLMLSPGFDDQRFVVRNAAVEACILYGPGALLLAHAPDEYVLVEDLVHAAAVMALSTADLLGAAGRRSRRSTMRRRTA